MADSKTKANSENAIYLESVIQANQPKSEEDLLILTVHAVLLKNGLKILGVGSSDNSWTENTSPSQQGEGLCLPNGWNSQPDPDCYEFSYSNESGEVYNLRALRIDDKIYVNLMRQGDSERSAAEVQINVTDVVKRQKKPVTLDWLVNVDSLWSCIERNFADKLRAKYEKKGSEQEIKDQLHTTLQAGDKNADASLLEQASDDLTERRPANLLERSPASYGAVGSFPQPPPPSLYSQEQHLPRASPFAYGDADRLPGHPGMGGMMMDPLRSGGMGLRPQTFPGIPRGSVPPGARFDPYGPLTEFDHSTGSRVPRRSFNPNPDHLRRPDFDDDMFM